MRHDITTASSPAESPPPPMPDPSEDRQRPTRPGRHEASPEARVLRSADLFAGRRTVMIEHAGEQYRLTITRNNKLILQK